MDRSQEKNQKSVKSVVNEEFSRAQGELELINSIPCLDFHCGDHFFCPVAAPLMFFKIETIFDQYIKKFF